MAIKKMLLAILLLTITQTTYSDIFTPSHSCYKPFKPITFSSRHEANQFFDDVEAYKQCIEEFIEEQQDQVKKHLDAIEEATEEWNDFVNYELN